MKYFDCQLNEIPKELMPGPYVGFGCRGPSSSLMNVTSTFLSCFYSPEFNAPMVEAQFLIMDQLRMFAKAMGRGTIEVVGWSTPQVFPGVPTSR